MRDKNKRKSHKYPALHSKEHMHNLFPQLTTAELENYRKICKVEDSFNRKVNLFIQKPVTVLSRLSCKQVKT